MLTIAAEKELSRARSAPPAGRLVSLDVFRGITIAGMILVNNPGDWSHVYAPLEHAAWHGWTPTDLIFPFFLFIVGVAMPFSFNRRLSLGDTKLKLWRHIVNRSSLLVLLGMILTGIPDFNYYSKLLLDVLQRIGVIYLFAGTLVLLVGTVAQAVLAVAFIVLYWVLMTVIPVPGYGAGILAPDGNVWQYVDHLLTAGWHNHGEGILSLIPSISTVLFGSLTGIWLRTERGPYEKAAWMFAAGAVGLAAGAVMDTWFPINKLLWSSSYVVFTVGFALQMLAFCYLVIDILQIRRWAMPFLVFGMNAIAVFFLSSLTGKVLGLLGVIPAVFNALFASWLPPYDSALAYALCYVLFWLAIMSILYKKRIFIKI
jgi:predicted acyltransferase